MQYCIWTKLHHLTLSFYFLNYKLNLFVSILFEKDIFETLFYYLFSMIIYSVVKNPIITNISFYKKF